MHLASRIIVWLGIACIAMGTVVVSAQAAHSAQIDWQRWALAVAQRSGEDRSGLRAAVLANRRGTLCQSPVR
jgi:hypothetical protein